MNEKIIRLPHGIVLHVHSRDDEHRAKKRKYQPARDALPRRLGRHRCVGERQRIPS